MPTLNELKITYDLTLKVEQKNESLSSIKESIKIFLRTKNYDEVDVNIEDNKLIVDIKDKESIDSSYVTNAIYNYSTWSISIRDSMDNLLATN